MAFDAQTLPHEAVNILLVDDQPANLASYQALLKGTGDHLILANSAQQALEELSKFDVAVVLINVCLRDSDGFELCKAIQQHPRCKSTSILLVSANPIAENDCLKGHESGATDYILLPVIPEIFRSKVALLGRLYRNAEQLEKLRKSAQRKNHFLAALAHELRDPLAPIASAVKVLQMKAPLDKDFQWISEVIERQVVSLKKLIDDLLDIGRISQNRLVLQRENVELISIVIAASKGARPAIEQNGYKFSLKLPKEPVYVFADPNRLTQVFRSLLDNSAKLTNAGGRISLVAELEDAGVAIRITNNGVGMPEDEMGVGLSLVWQLVEIHGGTVEVSRRGSGMGREFIVHLPVLAELPGDPNPGPAESFQPASTLRILIAEDNPDSAATLAMSLRLKGHIVEIAHDGIQALEIAEAFHPQVALLDIGMPKVNGYDLASKIRRLDWSKDTLLIAQTGWARPEDWEQAVISGFNLHLTKPLNYDTLTKILDNVVSRPPERRPDNGNRTVDPESSPAQRKAS